MITLSNLSLAFGEQTIFNAISAQIQPYDKIGLVGPNGAGKSTLLKVIAGIQSLDGGKVQRSGGVSIAYMPQEMVLTSQLSVFDETMQAYGELGVLHVKEKELAAAGQQGSEEYAHIHHELADGDHGAKSAHARRVLIGLGFEQSRHDLPVSALSVGWQMRVVLAKLLLQDADFYLFDEPTNHLDLPARQWLCSFLRASRSGYLLISHDRYVLDQVCDATLVIGQGRLRSYDGNYSYYRRVYEERLELQRAAKVAQDKEIARKQRTIDRFRSKSTKAKMAQSMIKQLERIERIEVDEEALPQVALPFAPVSRAGRVVLTVQGVNKSFDDNHVLKDVSLTVERGQRVGIVAPNGAGKTTLLSCIYGGQRPDAGSIELGHNVKAAVFEQEQVRSLNLKNTVLQEVEEAACPGMRSKVRTMLGALLFSGDTVNKKIKVLSGGERNRVALAKVLVQDANLLLLDEPTNHLDLLTQQVLAHALAEYEGTVVFVSHDREMVDVVATAIVSLDHGHATMYPGTYESFLFSREQQQQVEANASTQKHKKKGGGGQQREQKKQLARLERDIAKAEQQEADAVVALGSHEYGTPEYDAVLVRYEQVRDRLAALHAEWEELYG